MVSFSQSQCMNCGSVSAHARSQHCCSQCGFTTLPVQSASSMSQDEGDLAALFSKNMFLSQQQQPQPLPRQEQQCQTATMPVNFSISQHYHHSRPIIPPAPVAIQRPCSPITPPPTTPNFLEHLLQTSSNPSVAYQDYYRHLQLQDEHYNLQQQLEQQKKQQHQHGSPLYTASSVNDDNQFQMLVSEQERQSLAHMAEEERLIHAQLMGCRPQYNAGAIQLPNGAWTCEQPMPPPPPPPAPQKDPALRKSEDFNNFYNSQSDGMFDDEDSPCVVYHSRGYRTQYHYV